MKLTAAQLANYQLQQARGSRVNKTREASAWTRRKASALLEHGGDHFVLQLGLYVLPLNENGTEWARGDDADPADFQRNTIWKELTTSLRSLDRETIVSLQFERLSPSKGLDAHDNLPASFKYACDAVCVWVFEGPNVWRVNSRTYGRYDDMFVRTGGVICTPTQRQYDSHGIRITMQLGESRSPMPEPSKRSRRSNQS